MVLPTNDMEMEGTFDPHGRRVRKAPMETFWVVLPDAKRQMLTTSPSSDTMSVDFPPLAEIPSGPSPDDILIDVSIVLQTSRSESIDWHTMCACRRIIPSETRLIRLHNLISFCYGKHA